MKKKEILSTIGRVLLLMVAFMVGATSGVSMAEAIPLEGGGAIATHGVGADGVATMESNSKASPDLYLSDIDAMITKIRPNFVPLDTITRHARQVASKSIDYKYYSLATKPIKTSLKTVIAKQTSGNLVTLEADNEGVFDVDDTIRVVGVKGFVDGKEDSPSQEDLVLSVGGTDANGNVTVFAVNGIANSNGHNNYLPAIAKGTTLIRMGKACSELAAQTSAFANVPTPKIMYCQNFMAQVEEGTLSALSNKEVGFGFTEMEEDNLFAMKEGQELSYLFGCKEKKSHPIKKNESISYTGGVWWQAKKDIEIGAYDEAKGEVVLTDGNLVDFSKLVMRGNGVGSTRKILLAGADLVAAFEKIESNKFITRDVVEHWDLRFKSYETNFGEILLYSYPMFDDCDMADCGFLLDPEYITKVSFLSLKTSALELAKAGVRNSKATVLQEISGVYLRGDNPHARVYLAKKPTV